MADQKTRAPLIFQCTIAAPPAAVFETFFEQPTRWLCRDASVQAREGGALRLCWPDGCYEGRFVQCAPPETARFSWRMQGDTLPETMIVTSFVPTERGGTAATAFELEHYGFGVGPDWDMAYMSAARAWAMYVKNLRAVLEAGLDLREADE